MTIEQLATVVTNDTTFCFTWLTILTVLWVISTGALVYKIYQQSNAIDDLTYIIDKIDRHMRKRSRK